MKRKLFLCALSLVLVFCVVACSSSDEKAEDSSSIIDLLIAQAQSGLPVLSDQAASPSAGGFKRVKSLSDYYTKISESKDPVFVYFYATSCPYCKLMKTQMDKFIAYYGGDSPKMTLLQVNALEDVEIPMCVGISCTPTYVIYHNGQMIANKSGLCSFDDLKSFVKNNTYVR